MIVMKNAAFPITCRRRDQNSKIFSRIRVSEDAIREASVQVEMSIPASKFWPVKAFVRSAYR